MKVKDDRNFPQKVSDTFKNFSNKNAKRSWDKEGIL